jgi:hypothetical protein
LGFIAFFLTDAHLVLGFHEYAIIFEGLLYFLDFFLCSRETLTKALGVLLIINEALSENLLALFVEGFVEGFGLFACDLLDLFLFEHARGDGRWVVFVLHFRYFL